MRIHGVLKRLLPICAILFVCLVSMPGAVLAAEGILPDVSVYAEGAYTDTDLVLYIYADISVVTTGEPILSFGVRVDYPAELSNPVATKNIDVWYFGNGASEYGYMEPETDGTGVVIIGGKLNTSNPTEGVQGTRVLLGTVTFDHSIADPQDSDFSTVSVTYGRDGGAGDYKNFVDVDGDVVDGAVVFAGNEIHERGDANGDGIVNFQDMLFIRNYTENGGLDTPYADCNDDTIINFQDMLCVRAKTEG